MLAATLLFITIIKIAISANSEHGYFRADVDNAKAPLCARSDVFQFPNRTLHTGSWKIIGNDPLDSSTATSFLARDPQHGQCVVGPITQLHALECLRGRNIILIGDSITRNVFDPLVWWLERGERTEPKFSYPDIDKVPFVGDGGCGVGPLRCDACRSHNTTVPQVDNKHYSSRGVNVSLLGLYNFAGGRLPIHYTSGRGKGVSELACSDHPSRF